GAIHPLPSAAGSAFELIVSHEAAGFRLTRGSNGREVVLTLVNREREDFEAFAPEGAPGPRLLRVVVLDPGHGGVDTGVSAGGLVEKNLTLQLARTLKSEIERRFGARVVLTRDEDRE